MSGRKRFAAAVFVFLVFLTVYSFLSWLPLTAEEMGFENVGAATIITVDSGADPDNSKSKSCLSDTPCTLRRAIVQARLVPQNERPVIINFDISTEDDSYNPALQVWALQLLASSDPAVFRRLEGGAITIDGGSQPGGRSDGPKIILIGPGNGNKDGLIVGVNNSGSHDFNEIRGLAFQNFKTHVIVNSNSNLIEENWFGLTADGLDVYLRDDEPEDGSGSAGVALSANVTQNVIRQNVFLGFDGVAATLRGEKNAFSENLVGLNAQGEAPGKQTDADLICSKVDWLGGGGLNLDGELHSVHDNVLAGLRQEIFRGSTQPPAIELSGSDHSVFDNVIGKDLLENEIGVCGRGIYLTTSPSYVIVTDNTIVNPGLSAISLNGALYDGNTLRGNTIKSDKQWPQVEGNPEKEDAIQLGPSLPDALQGFQPAQVTAVNGTTVMGTHGPGSPCPDCVIELFLDDKDGIKEALQSLALVTADENGDWTADIPFELNENQSLRTTSTSAKFNTIKGLDAGTTSGLSALYVPQNPGLFLPLIIAN